MTQGTPNGSGGNRWERDSRWEQSGQGQPDQGQYSQDEYGQEQYGPGQYGQDQYGPHDQPGLQGRYGRPGGGLLEQNALMFQQVTGFMSNNFEITDLAGAPVGQIITGGSGLSRAFLGSRKLTVSEMDGTPVVLVDDVVSLGFDRFTLADPNGNELAQLRTKLSFLRTRVGMELVGGHSMELTGNVLGFEFGFEIDGRQAARVTREWAGMGRAFLGHSRYRLDIDPALPAWLRAAVIGGVVVLDLIRAKADRG
ncbi:LURP-one-related/scramblase family protein [Corynebacterium frankenforstense]